MKYICFDCSEQLNEANSFKKKCDMSMIISSKNNDGVKINQAEVGKYRCNSNDEKKDNDSKSSNIKKPLFKIPKPSSKPTNSMDDKRAKETVFKCEFCHHTFQTHSGLCIHMKWHKNKNDNRYKCAKCKLTFLNKHHEKEHIYKFH